MLPAKTTERRTWRPPSDIDAITMTSIRTETYNVDWRYRPPGRGDDAHYAVIEGRKIVQVRYKEIINKLSLGQVGHAYFQGRSESMVSRYIDDQLGTPLPGTFTYEWSDDAARMQATITSEALMVVDSAYTELTPAQVSNSKRLKHESRWRISR